MKSVYFELFYPGDFALMYGCSNLLIATPPNIFVSGADRRLGPTGAARYIIILQDIINMQQ